MRKFEECERALTAAIRLFARDAGDVGRSTAVAQLAVYAAENKLPANLELEAVAVRAMRKLDANRRREKAQMTLGLSLFYGGVLVLVMMPLATWLLDPVANWGVPPLVILGAMLSAFLMSFVGSTVVNYVYGEIGDLNLDEEERAVGWFFETEWEPSSLRPDLV